MATGVTIPTAVDTASLGDMVDLGTNRRIETGKPIYARLTFPVSATAIAANRNAKAEFRFHVSSLQSLGNLTAAATVIDPAAPAVDYNLFTLAAHGLVDGTRVNYVSGGSNLLTTRPYYVTKATADTFQLAHSPGGDTQTVEVSSAGNVVLTPHSECVGSTGPTPIQQLAKGDVLHVALNPTPFNGQPPLARYLFCEVVRTGAVTNGGTVSIAIVLDPSDYATYYKSGFVVE